RAERDDDLLEPTLAGRALPRRLHRVDAERVARRDRGRCHALEAARPAELPRDRHRIAHRERERRGRDVDLEAADGAGEAGGPASGSGRTFSASGSEWRSSGRRESPKIPPKNGSACPRARTSRLSAMVAGPTVSVPVRSGVSAVANWTTWNPPSRRCVGSSG